jgi:hypothetical protein
MYYLVCNDKWSQVNAPGPIPKSQPAAKIAHFVLKNPFPVSLPVAEGLYHLGYSSTWQATLAKVRQGGMFINDFVGNLKGYCHLRVDRSVTEPQGSHIWYDGADLVSLCWITGWAMEAFDRAQFIELDCSWKAVKPYAYCIPLAIINNEALPLGLILTPTECLQTYKWFFEDLAAYFDCELPSKPVLSDEGSALDAFCTHREWPHYFCYFHLIQKFRKWPILQLLATRILRISTHDEFTVALEYVVMQLALLLERRHIDHEGAGKFAEFLGYPAFPIERGSDNKYMHGIWDRHDMGDPTSNAHEERIHRTAETKSGQVTDTVSKLHQVEGVINSKYEEFQAGEHRQRKRTVNQMKAQKATPREVCVYPSCIRRRDLLARRFGVPDFPCKHTVNAFDFGPDDGSTRLTSRPPPPSPTPVVSDVDGLPIASSDSPPREPADPPFIFQFEPLRGLPSDDRSFLILVMHETAKFNGIPNKKDLVLQIWEAWGKVEDKHRAEARAEFWVDCLYGKYAE